MDIYIASYLSVSLIFLGFILSDFIKHKAKALNQIRDIQARGPKATALLPVLMTAVVSGIALFWPVTLPFIIYYNRKDNP